jgi:hypothetical protein
METMAVPGECPEFLYQIVPGRFVLSSMSISKKESLFAIDQKALWEFFARPTMGSRSLSYREQNRLPNSALGTKEAAREEGPCCPEILF